MDAMEGDVREISDMRKIGYTVSGSEMQVTLCKDGREVLSSERLLAYSKGMGTSVPQHQETGFCQQVE